MLKALSCDNRSRVKRHLEERIFINELLAYPFVLYVQNCFLLFVRIIDSVVPTSRHQPIFLSGTQAAIGVRCLQLIDNLPHHLSVCSLFSFVLLSFLHSFWASLPTWHCLFFCHLPPIFLGGALHSSKLIYVRMISVERIETIFRSTIPSMLNERILIKRVLWKIVDTGMVLMRTCKTTNKSLIQSEHYCEVKWNKRQQWRSCRASEITYR